MPGLHLAPSRPPQPKDFLRALHPTGWHDLRALVTVDGERIPKAVENFAAADVAGVERFATTQSQRWDVYTGVATRNADGRTLADCLTLHALFADLDFKDSSEGDARARLDAFSLRPSMVVHSGGGLHCYWLLDEPLDLQNGGAPKAKQLLRALATALGTDLRSTDPAHILRMPGTLNHKYDPPRPVVMETCSTVTYPLADLLTVVGPLTSEPEPATAGPAVGHVSTKDKIRQAREFLKRQKPAIEGSGGDHHTFTMCCFIVMDHDLSVDDAFVALTPWNARCEPPWTETALREKIRNADRYSTGVRGALLQPERPRIVIRGGEMTPIVDAAEAALLASGVALYQRGGLLIHPVRLHKATEDVVRRDVGSLVLRRVQDAWLSEQMGRAAQWISINAKKEKKRIDPPASYPRTLLARAEWRFPVLRSVLTAPTLDRHGRIIETPGFDTDSGLLLDFAPGTFPPIPTHPTQDEARAALAVLQHPFREFPFVSDAAKSVALSAMLTALVRPSMRTSPLHGYDAPTAGSGKSLLAEGVGLLATGFRPPALAQGHNEEETEKRLSSVLFAGDSVIHMDNCERPIGGIFLCSMLTQEDLQARILGLSEMRQLPSTALVLASGNNLIFEGDAARRAVMCRLDAGLERPDTRVFTFDFHDEIRRDRPRLLVAGLTILRAYHLADRVTLTPMGSFADWERIRGALVWLDCADPADTRKTIQDTDPVKNDLLDVMDLWAASIGPNNGIEVSDISKRADAYADGGPDSLRQREAVIALRDKLIEVACQGKAWSGKSIGWWLRKQTGKVVGERCFAADTKGGDGQRWVLKAELELSR